MPAVDSEIHNSSTAEAVMWTISQIAERDDVSKQAVSKNVQRLVRDRGLRVDRNGRGEVSGVDVAEYYRLRRADFDRSELPPVDSAGVVVAFAAVKEAMREARVATECLIDRLPLCAGEMAAAVMESRGERPEAAAAVQLKALAFDLRREIDEVLRKTEHAIGSASRGTKSP
jgi:DNA-binding transcriptional ArsR family regulator